MLLHTAPEVEDEPAESDSSSSAPPSGAPSPVTPVEQWVAEVEKALDERTIGHNPERLSLMKGGVVYSNAVTTVSPTYATEALHAASHEPGCYDTCV